jgi:uncharacterized protein (TIGR03790 family)
MRTSARGVLFSLATACLAQQTPLADRVLVVVNDRMPKEGGTGSLGASIFVGQYYAAKRNIPVANILHLKTSPAEAVSMDEYKAEIENPLRKFLDANGGAMRRKILYIVPAYGVPVQISQSLAVDSVISMMYAGHEDAKPPLRNPYSGPVGSRPPHFDAWSDGAAAANGFKMFIVTRLDGPSALIARGLVDKALTAESSLTMKSGVAYFDHQGTRGPTEWQYAIDNEIKAAAELSRNRGFETRMNVQADAACKTNIPPATQYFYDTAAGNVALNAFGSTAGVSFTFAPLAEGDFSVRFKSLGVQNVGNTVSLTLAGASDQEYIRLVYPLAPFKGYQTTSLVQLEKVVGGAASAQATLKEENTAAKQINQVSELRIGVRKNQITAFHDGVAFLSAADTAALPLNIGRVTLTAQCLSTRIAGFAVDASSGKPVWSDTFATDSTPKYQWSMSPAGGLNALWVWGWYTAAYDAYRFVPGAVGAQLTSYTAIRIRTPQNSDPLLFTWSTTRWGGNWVPRMLEEGVTATWGAVNEPYAVYYAPGGNVFDHLWAGYNFGESFYIAQNAVRWVMTAIGDPLYAPAVFAQKHE